MKNSILIIFVVLFSNVCNAQEIVMKKSSTVKELKKGAYYKFPELNKFEGKWIFENDSEKFIVIIKNKKTFLEGKGLEFFRDYLQGYYYRTNADINTQQKKKKITIYNGAISGNSNIVRVLFWDEIKEKGGTLTFELLAPNKAKWTLKNKEGIRVGKFDPTFSVPTEVILTKIK